MQVTEIISFISISWLCYLRGSADNCFTLAGTCSLPWDGVWYDSAFPLNNVTFDRSSRTVEGWKIEVYTTQGTNWLCLEAEGNTLLFKSTNEFSGAVFGLPNFYVYRCIQWTKLSDDVYQYYVSGDEQPNIGHQRLYVDVTNTNATIDTACTSTTSPSTAEFHVLVRADSESSAQSNCPSLFLHNFTYYHDNGVIASCEPANGTVDGCYNRSQVAFDFTKCSAPVGFSTNGLFYCVHSETVGNVQYVITINPEPVDYTSTFKFTCFVLQESGPYIYASDTRGSCKRSQTPFTRETDGNGVVTMISHDSCPFTQPSNESQSNIIILVAVVVSSAILLVIVIVVIICCCCKKAMKRKLLCGQQTAESGKMDDEKPLTERVDKEKHTSGVISPETHSKTIRSSNSKEKTKKDTEGKIHIQESEKPTSVIKTASPYSVGQTEGKKQEVSAQKGCDGNAANLISLNEDHDMIKIDYENYLESSKNGKKLKKLGKVVFLEEDEQSHVTSLETPSKKEILEQTKSIEVRHVQGVNQIDATYSESVQNDNETDVHVVEELHVNHRDQLEPGNVVSSFVENTEKLTEDETIENSTGKSVSRAIRVSSLVENTEQLTEEETIKKSTNKTITKANRKDIKTVSRVQDNKIVASKEARSEKQTKPDSKTINREDNSLGNGDITVDFSERSGSAFQTQKTSSLKKSGKMGGKSEPAGENKFAKNRIVDKSVIGASVETINGDILLERDTIVIPCETPVKGMSVTDVKPSLGGHNPKHKTVVSINHKNQTDQQKPIKNGPEKSLKKAKKIGKVDERDKNSKVNAVKSKKKSGRKRQKSNLGDKELTNSIDGNYRCDTDIVDTMSLTHDHSNPDILNSDRDDFRELNSVNENQPTAVQAWGSLNKSKRYEENGAYDSEDEESLPPTPYMNENDSVNKMTYDQVLELRPKSSMAPVSTFMRSNTSSSYIIHDSERGYRQPEAGSRNSSSLKTTGLQGYESSTLLTKVDESMSSLQVIDM